MPALPTRIGDGNHNHAACDGKVKLFFGPQMLRALRTGIAQGCCNLKAGCDIHRADGMFRFGSSPLAHIARPRRPAARYA
jgi:hypothetical protein